MKRIALYMTLLLLPLTCQAAEPTIPKLSLRGDATLYLPADQMELTIGVVTQDKDSTQAVQDNNGKMHQVLEALNAIGLTSDDYQTGSFHIQPTYKYPQNEAARLVGYEVTNTIKIKTTKLELAEKMIGAAARAGANKVEQITFNLKDPQIYRELAIQKAAANALADAKALAQATFVQIVRVLSIDLDSTQNHYPRPIAYMAKMANSENSYDAPIEVGDVQVTAGVNITFEVESVGSYSKRN